VIRARALLRLSAIAATLASLVVGAAAQTGGDSSHLPMLLDRARAQASAHVEIVSTTNCTERVTQLKLDEAGKTIEKKESTFDYLVLLKPAGSELNLVESRLPAASDRRAKQEPVPLLVSNGFSLLFLVFHPYYSEGFEYTPGEDEMVGGRRFAALRFRHVHGTRSPVALAVRGREYALDIAGTALLDPDSGSIVRITASLDVDMADVGLRRFLSTIDYAPVSFGTDTYWLPATVTVDVESRRQHWRNIHQFSKYKRFGVDTKEQVHTP
jgi:hypothetical protein